MLYQYQIYLVNYCINVIFQLVTYYTNVKLINNTCIDGLHVLPLAITDLCMFYSHVSWHAHCHMTDTEGRHSYN